MAWPAVAAIGGTLLSSFMGNKAQQSAADEASRVAKINAKIAEDNLDFQKQAREESMALAREMLARGDLGQTDAYGNRTYFDPERGWVTDLSPMQALLAQQAQEEAARQGSDTTGRIAAAEQRGANMARTGERMYNDAVSDIRSAQRPDVSRLKELLYAKAMGANNEVADAAHTAVLRDLNASGRANPGNIMAAISGRAKQGAAAGRSAAIDAELAAMQYADQRKANDIAQASELAKQFGQIGGYSPSASLALPTGPARSGDASNFASQLISAAKATPSQDYISPDYGKSNAQQGTANLVQSGVNSLLGYYQNTQQGNQITDIADALKRNGIY